MLIVRAEVKVIRPETTREFAMETEDLKVTPEVNVARPDTPNAPETETVPRRRVGPVTTMEPETETEVLKVTADVNVDRPPIDVAPEMLTADVKEATPVTPKVPATVSSWPGDVVPMPTLPLLCRNIRSLRVVAVRYCVNRIPVLT